jgi:hypothetical protein
LLVDIITFVALLIPTVGLIFTGISFWRLGKTEELRTLELINKDIAHSLKEYNLIEAETPAPTEKEVHSYKMQYLLIDFFVDLNWLCYLFRHGQIKDKTLINAFRGQIITWYEDLFLKRMDKERIENRISFPDFKILYPQMKLEIEKENAFNKKHPHIAELKLQIRLIKI